MISTISLILLFLNMIFLTETVLPTISKIPLLGKKKCIGKYSRLY